MRIWAASHRTCSAWPRRKKGWEWGQREPVPTAAFSTLHSATPPHVPFNFDTAPLLAFHVPLPRPRETGAIAPISFSEKAGDDNGCGGKYRASAHVSTRWVPWARARPVLTLPSIFRIRLTLTSQHIGLCQTSLCQTSLGHLFFVVVTFFLYYIINTYGKGTGSSHKQRNNSTPGEKHCIWGMWPSLPFDVCIST